MKLWHRGTVRDIVFGAEAESTLSSAEAQVAGNKQRASAAQVRARLKLVGNFRKVSVHILRHEGDQVYAVKSDAGVRGYGWFDNVDGHPAFIVSHFVFKNWKKMRISDRDRVVAARNSYRRRAQ